MALWPNSIKSIWLMVVSALPAVLVLMTASMLVMTAFLSPPSSPHTTLEWMESRKSSSWSASAPSSTEIRGHIFQNAQVTSNKMVHKKRHHFLAQFSIVASVSSKNHLATARNFLFFLPLRPHPVYTQKRKIQSSPTIELLVVREIHIN